MSWLTRTPHAGASGGISVGGPTSVTSAPILTSANESDRPTRECSTSPTIATRSPSSRPSRSRIVYRSSSACVGCSCVPSPAFNTLPLTQRVSVSGAPLDECRITIASAPIAWSVSAVSLRLSPLETLEPLVEKLITSADRRLAASSKLIRVRVEFS